MPEDFRYWRRRGDAPETPTLTVCTGIVLHDDRNFVVVGAAIWDGVSTHSYNEGNRWSQTRMLRAEQTLNGVAYNVAAHIHRDNSPVAQVLTPRGFDSLLARLGEAGTLPEGVTTPEQVLDLLRPRRIKKGV